MGFIDTYVNGCIPPLNSFNYYNNSSCSIAIGQYKLLSQVVEIKPNNSLETYTLESKVTIETIDRGIIKVTIKDVSSSTKDPADLYIGILVGSVDLLTGQDGYQGTAIIKNCDTLEFAEPGSIKFQGQKTTAFYQQGRLIPV
jgi:hypothetical protein